MRRKVRWFALLAALVLMIGTMSFQIHSSIQANELEQTPVEVEINQEEEHQPVDVQDGRIRIREITVE